MFYLLSYDVARDYKWLNLRNTLLIKIVKNDVPSTLYANFSLIMDLHDYGKYLNLLLEFFFFFFKQKRAYAKRNYKIENSSSSSWFTKANGRARIDDSSKAKANEKLVCKEVLATRSDNQIWFTPT